MDRNWAQLHLRVRKTCSQPLEPENCAQICNTRAIMSQSANHQLLCTKANHVAVTNSAAWIAISTSVVDVQLARPLSRYILSQMWKSNGPRWCSSNMVWHVKQIDCHGSHHARTVLRSCSSTSAKDLLIAEKDIHQCHR